MVFRIDEALRARLAELIEEIETSSFRETKWGRRGYNERDVDDFLDYMIDVMLGLLSVDQTSAGPDHPTVPAEIPTPVPPVQAPIAYADMASPPVVGEPATSMTAPDTAVTPETVENAEQDPDESPAPTVNVADDAPNGDTMVWAPPAPRPDEWSEPVGEDGAESCDDVGDTSPDEPPQPTESTPPPQATPPPPPWSETQTP